VLPENLPFIQRNYLYYCASFNPVILTVPFAFILYTKASAPVSAAEACFGGSVGTTVGFGVGIGHDIFPLLNYS